MTTLTFEQATLIRIQNNPTWNLEQMTLALRTLWNTSPAIKSDLSLQVVKLFLAELESSLKTAKFFFFKTPQVTYLYDAVCNSVLNPTDFIQDVINPAMVSIDDLNAEMSANYTDGNDYYHNETNLEEATPMNTATAIVTKTISIFTDGSCNVQARTGGWGAHISMEGSAKTRTMSGSVLDTTNNVMELKAMIEGIKAITILPNFKYEFYTDSKYVLQSIANKEKNLASNFAKMKNPEILQELYATLDSKGIVLTQITQPVMGNKTLASGDVVHEANEGVVLFKWVKGHSDHPGNDEADRLALEARKQLDKTGIPSSDASTTKAIAEVSEEASVAPEAVVEVVVPEPEEYNEPEVVAVKSSVEVIADKLTEVYQLPEPDANDTVVATSSFADALFEMDNSPSNLELSGKEFTDVQEIHHDRNIDIWRELAMKSEVMLNALAFFEYSLADIEENLDLYEDFKFDMECEYQTNKDLGVMYQEVMKFGDWIPSLKQEIELDLMTHKEGRVQLARKKAATRTEDNIKFPQACDDMDTQIKQMEEEIVLPSSVEVDLFEVLFEQEYTGIRFKAFSETAYPIKNWADCEMTYIPFNGQLPEDVIKTQDCDGLDIYFTPDNYKIWGEVLEVDTCEEETYGEVVYENDYVTMSNPEGGFEEVCLPVQVVSEGLVYDGNLYSDIEAVVAKHVQESKNSIAYINPEVQNLTSVAPTDEEISSQQVDKPALLELLDKAETFADIKEIISYSNTITLGGTCGEDFTYYTAVIVDGKSVFEIVSPERKSSQAGYIRSAVSQLKPYLVAEGLITP